MFFAEIVAVHVDDKYINDEGALDVEKAGLIAYAHGFYYTLGRKLGKFGFSVEKKKTVKKRLARQKKKSWFLKLSSLHCAAMVKGSSNF